MNVLHRVGDVCPEDHGGGAVVVTADGYTMLEYTHGLAVTHPDTTCYGEDERDALCLSVFQVRLDESAWDAASWASWLDIANYAGQAFTDVKELAASADIADRARAFEMVAGYYGWRALDPEPMTLSYADVAARWPDTPTTKETE